MKRTYLLLLLLLGISCLAFAQPQQAGITNADRLHNGGARSVGIDDSGRVHVVWTNNLMESRHVNYNLWRPSNHSFDYAYGVPVEAPGYYSAYATIAVDASGMSYPAYHLRRGSSSNLTPRVAQDYMAGNGAFAGFPIEPLPATGDSVPGLLWPRIALGRENYAHVVSFEQPLSGGATFRLYYSRGVTHVSAGGIGEGITWELVDNAHQTAFLPIDTVDYESADIAASRNSGRVVIAWIKPEYGVGVDSLVLISDVFYRVSEDDGHNWGPPVNVTQIIRPDRQCWERGGDWHCCDGDTLVPFMDVTVVLDHDDNAHIAFTARAYYQFRDSTEGPFIESTSGMIWNWNESSGTLSPVAKFYADPSIDPTHRPKPVHCILERPSLTIDAFDRMSCSYLQYDTSAWSVDGSLNADVFVSASTDLGETWSVGTNVTHSRPVVIPAPEGQNTNEQDPSLALNAGDHAAHLFYMLDQSNVNLGGGAYNPVFYQRVPDDSVPLLPVMPQETFHVDAFPCDTLRAPNVSSGNPTSLGLAPAYPNPFNSSTVLRFDLPQRAEVTLKIFDVLGREAATLTRGMMDAGTHAVEWNPGTSASGIYFARLEASHETRTQKLVYLR